MTQHSNLSGSLRVLILSPLVLTLPPRFVTSIPLISTPPEFSSSDKSDKIKDRALGTPQGTSLEVDNHCRELHRAPPRMKSNIEQGCIHGHSWDCLILPLPPHLLLPSHPSLLKPTSLYTSPSLGLPHDPSFHFCPIQYLSEPLSFTHGPWATGSGVVGTCPALPGAVAPRVSDFRSQASSGQCMTSLPTTPTEFSNGL